MRGSRGPSACGELETLYSELVASGVAPGLVIAATAPSGSGRITNTAAVPGYELDLDLSDSVASASTLVMNPTYFPIILK